MFPRNYADAVPAAGIRKTGYGSVAQCLICDDEYRGPDSQTLYRHRWLGEPGQRLHTPGIYNPDPPPNVAFGMRTPGQNSSTWECVHTEPVNTTQPYLKYMDKQEARYLRSKHKLGAVPDGVAEIPDELLKTGFGINTKFGESVGDIVQKTHQSIPLNKTLQTGYQTTRNYDWTNTGINPNIYTFGIQGESQIDHVTEIMNYDDSTKIVPTAVDRADHNAIVPDPDPVDPRPRTIMRTMVSTQIKDSRDPSERPPAGLSTRASEFTIGDTFAGMGAMDSHDPDYRPMPRDYRPEDDMVHGVPTKPNPFPNPLRGPGKYINLGLSDEDFLLLRDRAHIIPVMVQALCLSEEEANNMFDNVAQRCGRQKISVSEFYDYYRTLTH
ncbi:hypothetical protein TRFO_26475 [Tritrichomonas foetus]|uniref:Uncharacterized protein n=1 Tax=Tritrichomonas foetus TaxID=1144522 RepID=A0A1J4K7R9_9EUKA|nr:hypothetical protein TRFO_26475 [Tritrichomonas foetus]|eukprot:OHT05734.1 hypothetical protein TRFO_26475 [Tritrichomonas foetus]